MKKVVLRAKSQKIKREYYNFSANLKKAGKEDQTEQEKGETNRAE